MAYIENPLDQDEQTNTDQQQQQQSAGGGGGTPTAVTQAASPQQPKGSGRFTNIYKYIGANKPQSQRLAETVVGGVQKQSDKARQDISQAQQQFQQTLEPEKQRLGAGQQFVQSTIAEAPEAVKDINQFNQFQQYRKALGPYESLQTPAFSSQEQQARTLESEAQAAARSGGKTALLSRTLTSPTYTTGQRSLDQLLLEGTRGAKDTFLKGVKQATSGLVGGVEQAKQSGLQDIQGLKTQAQELGQQTQEKLTGVGGAIPGILSSLDERIVESKELQQKGFEGLKNVLLQGRDMDKKTLDLMGVPEEAQKEFTYYYNSLRPTSLKDKINSGEGLTKRDVELLGYKPEQVDEVVRMWGGDVQGFRGRLKEALKDQMDSPTMQARTGAFKINPNDFLTALSPDVITRANVATPEEYTRYLALSRLAESQGGDLRPENLRLANTALNRLGNLDYAKYISQARESGYSPYDPNTSQVNFAPANDPGPDTGPLGMGPLLHPTAMLPAMLLENTPLAPLANIAVAPALAAAQAAESLVRSVTNIFCFEANTPITMANGLTKRICDIDLDDLLVGGRVLAKTVAKVNPDLVYNYKGITVTAEHAVFENGKWLRVQNSSYARKVIDGPEKIYSLVTTEHRLVIDGILFADQVEHDEQLTNEESLLKLNLNADKDEFFIARNL